MNTKIHTLTLKMSTAYLVEYQGGILLVDSGIPGEEKRIWRSIQKTGKPLRLIFLTHAHFDHFGSAAALRRFSRAPIAIHHADARALSLGLTPIRQTRGRGSLTKKLLPLAESLLQPPKTRADILLEDGDSLPVNDLETAVLHTPGHTCGSSCLLLKKSAFIGDLASSSRKAHLQSLYAWDWQALENSLLKLASLDLQTYYPGHGKRPITKTELLELMKKNKIEENADRHTAH